MTFAASGMDRSTLGNAMSNSNDKKGNSAVARHLPPKGQGQIFGGHGQGEACSLCGVPIESTQIEYEVEWQDEAGPRRAHFHLACYAQLRSDPVE